MPSAFFYAFALQTLTALRFYNLFYTQHKLNVWEMGKKQTCKFSSEEIMNADTLRWTYKIRNADDCRC